MNKEHDQWIKSKCWEELINKMPIPCVDVIVYRGHEFLMGWRAISPYRNVWALIGGRMLHGESFSETAHRQCKNQSISISDPQYVGTFPVKFPSRHDIVMCMTAEMKSGIPSPTEELTRFHWHNINEIDKIKRIGGNYKKMLQSWRDNFVSKR